MAEPQSTTPPTPAIPPLKDEDFAWVVERLKSGDSGQIAEGIKAIKTFKPEETKAFHTWTAADVKGRFVDPEFERRKYDPLGNTIGMATVGAEAVGSAAIASGVKGIARLAGGMGAGELLAQGLQKIGVPSTVAQVVGQVVGMKGASKVGSIRLGGAPATAAEPSPFGPENPLPWRIAQPQTPFEPPAGAGRPPTFRLGLPPASKPVAPSSRPPTGPAGPGVPAGTGAAPALPPGPARSPQPPTAPPSATATPAALPPGPARAALPPTPPVSAPGAPAAPPPAATGVGAPAPVQTRGIRVTRPPRGSASAPPAAESATSRPKAQEFDARAGVTDVTASEPKSVGSSSTTAARTQRASSFKDNAYEVRDSSGGVVKRFTEREFKGNHSLKPGQSIVMRNLKTGEETLIDSNGGTAVGVK